MDIVHSEDAYFESFSSALAHVEIAGGDRGQEAEDRLFELLDQIPLQRMWDYAVEWRDEPNCCVIVLQNIAKLTGEVFAALQRVSYDYPNVLIHLIVMDSIHDGVMTGGDRVAQLFILNERIPKLLVRLPDHPSAAAIISMADSVG